MDQAVGNSVNRFDDATLVPAARVTQAGEPGAEAQDGSRATDKQLYAGREWTSEHPLNIRMSIPIGIGRYYITLVAGRERRARARLALDRRQNPLDTPGNVFFLAFISLITTAGSATILYLLLAHVFGWSGRLIF